MRQLRDDARARIAGRLNDYARRDRRRTGGEVNVLEIHTGSPNRRDDRRCERTSGSARCHERRRESGATFPFSGPASPLSNTGKGLIAYVNSINDRGGINGSKIDLITYDDAYSPPKGVFNAGRRQL